MGDALLQKSFTTDTLPYRRMINQGEKPKYYVEHANPAIISKEVFETAQEFQKAKRINPVGKRKNFPLTKLIRCPDCGRAFRRHTTAGKAYWICSARSSGALDCQMRRVREDMVYDAFLTMLYKLKDNRHMLIDSLIRQIELMQSRSGGIHEAVYEIDKQIADLGTQNLVLARLHTNGILNAAEYASQSSEISNKITALRVERRKKIAEDADDELLDDLRTLDDILENYEPSEEFDEELFGQTVERITVNDNTRLTFRLLGGLELTETIKERGRCKPV